MLTFVLFSLLILSSPPSTTAQSTTVCIVGGGIGGASVSHFLRHHSSSSFSSQIKLFERNSVVGGRMATITIGGDIFEAGASILHPKNYYASNFTKMLDLKVKKSEEDDGESIGVWDGKGFVLKTRKCESKNRILRKLVDFANSVRLFVRYGVSLLRMGSFVETTVDNFLKYYEKLESRPVFETVDEMLKWAGLYNLTGGTLHEELISSRLSPLLIDELVTVITRINYGQSVNISGLAGAVSLAGSGGGLWAVEGGNWQMAAGLINRSDVELHLNEEIDSISNLGHYYELNSTIGKSYACDVAVIATPLDELNIQFSPPISIPERKLQHTYTTFVRGLLNPEYFGLSSTSEIPELVGTVEDPEIPFSCISVLKQHSEKDMTYKMFSREPMADTLLDLIYSMRAETIRIDWAAYPHYNAPESFAPFILDGMHLYYVNAFENAASTMETSAVAAENVARLILSKISGQVTQSSSNLKSHSTDKDGLHTDL